MIFVGSAGTPLVTSGSQGPKKMEGMIFVGQTKKLVVMTEQIYTVLFS